jgi:DNA-binding transcriptional LysR family regulator
LIFAGHASGNRPLLDAALAERGIALQAQYEVQRSSTALGLVAEGVAPAIVPSLAIQKGSYPRIKVVALTDPVVSANARPRGRENAGISRRRPRRSTT